MSALPYARLPARRLQGLHQETKLLRHEATTPGLNILKQFSPSLEKDTTIPYPKLQHPEETVEALPVKQGAEAVGCVVREPALCALDRLPPEVKAESSAPKHPQPQPRNARLKSLLPNPESLN